jgi:hypothetical protein
MVWDEAPLSTFFIGPQVHAVCCDFRNLEPVDERFVIGSTAMQDDKRDAIKVAGLPFVSIESFANWICLAHLPAPTAASSQRLRTNVLAGALCFNAGP